MTAVILDVAVQGTRPEAQAPTWVPPLAAVEAWLALMRAVRALDERRRPVPCSVDPERWWAAPTAPQTRQAAELCAGCPAVRLCREYALAAEEKVGVWGGTTPADRGWVRKWSRS